MTSSTASRVGERQRSPSVLLLALSAVLLGGVVHQNWANPPSTLVAVVLAASLALLVTGTFGVPLPPWLRQRQDPLALWLIRACVLVSLATLLLGLPAEMEVRRVTDLAPNVVVIAIVAGIAGAAFLGLRVAQRILVPAAIALHAVLGIWVISMVPAPPIDVFVSQQLGAEYLLGGVNPYAVNFPNIYGPDSPYISPELVDGDRLTVGFPYAPLSLFLVTPAYAVFGDHRYAQLLAMEVAALLIARLRPGPLAQAVAVSFLFMPRTFYVLSFGFTEPLAAALIAATCLSAMGSPRHVSFWMGAFAGLKQHLLFALPAIALLPGHRLMTRRFLLTAATAVVMVLALSAPFLLLDARSFINSAVLLPLKLPFRTDALGFFPWLAELGATGLPLWVNIPMAVGTAFALWRWAPQSVASFAAGSALLLFMIVAFSKHPNPNYYYLVLAAIACAIAATPGRAEPRPGA